jgi:hypothetical protein
MNELVNQKENKVEIVAEEQQRKEIKFIGKQIRRRGLTLWELNLKEKTLEPATFKKENVAVKSLKPTEASSVKHLKVDAKEDCIYFQALNRKNAIAKVKRRFGV